MPKIARDIVLCPICDTPMMRSQLNPHLRRIHRSEPLPQEKLESMIGYPTRALRTPSLNLTDEEEKKMRDFQKLREMRERQQNH